MPNQTLKLKRAAILVSRGVKVLQAAPAGELHRSALQNVHKSNGEPMADKIGLEMIPPRESQPPDRPDGDPKELNTCGW